MALRQVDLRTTKHYYTKNTTKPVEREGLSGKEHPCETSNYSCEQNEVCTKCYQS